ncbi:MAG: hypothetical protein DMG07_07250 [Acidobacteria bacterium]|nr:MAG: hypothetical protein DMG07_07250 [Acidobacteriota bacterium]
MLPVFASQTQLTQKTAGIKTITKRPVAFRIPPDTPKGQTWRYGLTIPFQIAPRRAAVFCNIRLEYPPGGDYELGTDVIIFDDVSRIQAAGIVPVSRFHEEPNPHSKPPGQRSFLLKYPVRGGFVPLGAKRADGSPHPHAGTGFGLSQALAWPVYTRDQIRAATDNLEPYGRAESYAYFELQQYKYDGKSFRVLNTERFSDNDLLPGWAISNSALTNAIPDGDDLLFGLTGEKAGLGKGAGVSTWRRTEKGWHPVSFTPVTGDDHSIEASLIRDVDGGLLFCARGSKNDTRNNLRVWRSPNGKAPWKQVINVRGIVSGPITINRAADGTPYVISDLYQVFLYPLERRWVIIVGPGLVPQGGWMRETLCLWPLNAERTDVQTPIVVRDSRAEFGTPPDGSTWLADHPSAMTVQLADGAWHNILGYRIGTRGEMTNYGSDPAPQTGAYIQEVISAGRAIPTWNL